MYDGLELFITSSSDAMSTARQERSAISKIEIDVEEEYVNVNVV